MTKIQTIDEYIEKYFPYWKEASISHLGRYVDPRQGGQFLIEQTEAEKAKDPNWYRQQFNCMPLDRYLSTAETIASLSSHDDILTPQQVVQILSENSAQVMLDRYDHSDVNPFFPDNSISRQVQGDLEWQKKRGIKEPRAINRAIAISLLQGRSNIGANSDIPILTDNPDGLEEMAQALNQNPNFSQAYRLQKSIGEHNNVMYFFMKPNGEHASDHRLEKEAHFPDNRVDYRNGGANAFETLEIVKIIAEIVKDRNYAAHFGLIYRPDVHGQEIHGAFYDPNYKADF